MKLLVKWRFCCHLVKSVILWSLNRFPFVDAVRDPSLMGYFHSVLTPTSLVLCTLKLWAIVHFAFLVKRNYFSSCSPYIVTDCSCDQRMWSERAPLNEVKQDCQIYDLFFFPPQRSIKSETASLGSYCIMCYCFIMPVCAVCDSANW